MNPCYKYDWYSQSYINDNKNIVINQIDIKIISV